MVNVQLLKCGTSPLFPSHLFCLHLCSSWFSLALFYSSQHFFSKLLHFQPLLFWRRHSYLYKVVSASSTYGVNQQCPLKDERIWGEMLRHSWTWRTTQTSPRLCFNTWNILAFRTKDLHVWLQIFDWFGLFLTVISEPLEQQVLSCICDQWWRDWSHAPITGDMLLPHFAELKLCRETPTLVNIHRTWTYTCCLLHVWTLRGENGDVQNQRPFSLHARKGLLGKSLTQLDLNLNKSNSPQTLEDKQSTLSVSSCHQHEWSR